MKKGKRILIAILTMLCVVAAVLGIVGCGGSCNSNSGGGSTKYDGLYNAYVRALEDGEALGHDAWYDTYKDAIDNSSIGDNYTIDTAEAVTDNGVEYVEYLLTNGKIYRLTVEGSDFEEYVVFTLTAKSDDGQEATNANLDIYYVNGEDRIIWRTVKLDDDGVFKLYVPAKDTKTYGIKVSATGNSYQVYGIPVGDEPTFNVESEKSIEITLYEPVAYRVMVEDVTGSPLAGVEVGIYYNDEDNQSVIVRTVTGATGTLTAYFVVKEGSSYIIKISELPPAYSAEEESYPLNFNTGITTIVLIKTGVITDVDVPVPENIAQQAEGDIRYTPANVSLTTPYEPYRQSANNYTLGSEGAQLYVQFTKIKAGVHTSKSILELVTEDETYFNALHLHKEEGQSDEDALVENVWDRYIYGKMLKAYADKVNSDGLYALTDELYAFIKDCASMFAGATGSEKDYLNALVFYNGPALALGPEGSIEVLVNPEGGAAVNVPVKAGMPAGYYKLSLKRGVGAGGVGYTIIYSGQTYPVLYNATSINIMFKANFSSFQIISDAPAAVGTHKLTLTLEMGSELGDVDIAKSLSESGEYYVVLYPYEAVKNVSQYYHTFNTTLPVRDYYTYTVEVLDAPEGVTVNGKFYVCDDRNMMSIKWVTETNITGPVTQTTYYSRITNNAQAKPCFHLYYTVGEDYEGDPNAMVIVKINFTIRLDRINITYSGGTGATGTMTGATNVVVGSTTALASNEFVNGNKVFVGWYDPVSQQIYKEGEQIEVPAYDLNLVAQWKEPGVNIVDSKLAVDTPLNVEIDTAQYTSTIIDFAEGIEAGKYTLKVDFGSVNYGNLLQIKLGNTTMYFVRSTQSTAEHNIYIYYLELSASDTQITLMTPTNSGKINATLTLTTYVGPELDVNSTEIQVRVGGYSINATTAFTFTLSNNIEPNTKYRVYFYNYSADTYYLSLYTGTSSTYSNPVSAGSYTIRDYTSPASIEDAVLYVRVYSSSTTYIKATDRMVGLKLVTAYTFQYDKNDDGQSSGSVSTSVSYYAEGETFALSTTKLTRQDYEFKGWSMDPDFDGYDPNETYLQPGANFEMPARNVVLKAVWRALVYNEDNELGLGEEGKLDNVVINRAIYEGTRVKLKEEVVDGMYILTVVSDHDLGRALSSGDPYIWGLYYGYSGTNNIYLNKDETNSSEGNYIYSSVIVVAGTTRWLHFYDSPAEETKISLKLEKYELKKFETDKELEVFVHPYNPKAPFIMYYEFDETMNLDYALTYYMDGTGDRNNNPYTFVVYTVNASGVSSRLGSTYYWAYSTNNSLSIPADTKGIYFASYNSSSSTTLLKLTFRRTYIVMYKGADDGIKDVSGTVASHPLLKSNSTITVRANGFTRDGYEFIGYKIQGDDSGTLYKFPQSVTLQSKDIIFVAQWKKIGGDDEPDEPVIPDKVEATLGKGEDAKAEIEITADKQAVFKLDDSVTVANYTLTIVSDADIGAVIKGEVGETDLYLVQADKDEDEGTYTYIGFVRPSATGMNITLQSGLAAKLTATLVTYSDLKVIRGGDAVVVPVNAYYGAGANSSVPSTYFKVTPMRTATAGISTGTFYYSIENVYNVNMGIYITLRTGQLVMISASRITLTVNANSVIISSKSLSDGNDTRSWTFSVSNASYPTVPLIFKLLDTVTVSYKGGEVEENEDPVSGSVSSATVAQGATHSLKANSFTRKGYTFIGWKLLVDGVPTGELLSVGATVTVYESQTYVAVWKKDLEDGKYTDGMLGFGSENKVTVHIDPTEKQSMTINVDVDELTTGVNYLITATLTADRGAYLMFTMEGGNIKTGADLTYDIYLVKDATKSVGGKYVYFGYLYIHEKSVGLKMSYKNETFEAFDMTLQLDNYADPVLKADGETYLIPVTPDYDEIMNGEDRIFIDFDIPTGKYKLYYYDLTGGKLSGNIYAYANKGSSSLFTVRITAGADGSNQDWTNKFDGVEDLDLRLYTKYVFSVIGVKIVRTHDVIYENGLTPEEIEDGESVGGSTSAQTYIIKDEEVLVSGNSFKRTGYVFLYWTDKDGKRYDRNNTITMGDEDIVLKAVWRKENIKVEEGILDLEATITITLDSTQYTATKFGLSLDKSKIGTYAYYNYRLMLDFGANEPESGWVLLYIPSSGLYLYMAKSEKDSSEGHNVYVGDFKPTTTTTDLQIITNETSYGTFENVTVTLKEIDFTWKPGETMLMAINGYSTSSNAYSQHVYYKGDDSTIKGAHYKITITDVTGMLIGESAKLYAGYTSADYTTTIKYNEPIIANLYSDKDYIVMSIDTSSLKYGTMVSVKIEWLVD